MVKSGSITNMVLLSLNKQITDPGIECLLAGQKVMEKGNFNRNCSSGKKLHLYHYCYTPNKE